MEDGNDTDEKFRKSNYGLKWENLVSYCSDNASVMIGKNNSVLSRIKEKQPAVIDLGCICHLANLVVKAAVNKLDLSVDHMLMEVNLHFNLSSKRKEEYKTFQEFCEVEPHKLIKHVQTRWLSLERCIKRALEQWPALLSYFSSHCDVEKPGRVKTCYEYLSKTEMKLYFHFLEFILAPMNEFNTAFQADDIRICFLYHDMIRLLRKYLGKFVQKSVIISANKLTEVSYDIAENQLSDDLIAIGRNTREFLSTVEEPSVKSHFFKEHKTQLYIDVSSTQWPIVYTAEYNIGFLGLEKLHPFDSAKWGRIFEFLKEAQMIRDDTVIKPLEATESDLNFVHSRTYLNSLKLTDIIEGISEWSGNVAGITEVPPIAFLPNCVVQRKVLRPFRYQTGGTILAGKLALDRGWAINIGGGFHHCSAERGGGFCAYADITLSIKFLFEKVENVSKVMIIDLDAHQGNGHERDFMNDDKVYILDVYNRGIYPQDGFAKRAIKRKVELQHFTGDEEYLNLIRRHVEGALNEFTPDIIVYNAGTDILDGDPLGNLSISAQGIIERDQIVFQKARTRAIPIFMVTSGGYLKDTARIIADSILNLKTLGLISWDEAEFAESEAILPRSQSESGLFNKFKRACLSRSSTQEFNQIDNPSASKIDNPSTSKIDNPSASKIDNPSASKIDNPSASKIDNPSASKIDNPSTSKTYSGENG